MVGDFFAILRVCVIDDFVLNFFFLWDYVYY